MGNNEGQALAYGHTKDVEGIEGLELLDQHFAAMRKEANGGLSDDDDAGLPDEDDEAGWDNWDMESNASTTSSGWEEVSEGGDEIELSDSEDDEPKRKKGKNSDDAPRKKAKMMAGAEEDEEDAEDVDMDGDDDTKSVVSAAPSAATEATKKLSLLAQQKVCRIPSPLEIHADMTDPNTCRFHPSQRTTTQSRQRPSRHYLIHIRQT
jgi:protein SDA1